MGTAGGFHRTGRSGAGPLVPSLLQHCPCLVQPPKKGQVGKLGEVWEKRHWTEFLDGATSWEPAGVGGGTSLSLFG